MKPTTSLEKAELMARLAVDKKGEDIVLMDMRGVTGMCDWFILVSVSSSRRLKAVFKEIEKELSKHGISPKHIEGKNDPHWVLLDYDDVVMHVFYKNIREFYSLEDLWSDAPIERFKGESHVQ